ncbi:cell division protein FtsQ/DivIB [Candidatus Nitrosacidococcus sp. I8]|uniref:cell division protein FtsQ/DivIB n=1 Tax=Candidatus Nitrosacidococcus sp. I8 TaxID=2942908 RepID=UPI0022272B8E|nr:FtsQ-type POTRA domain-containing protein [Candidatus Nitrosacidococcus sp. I8]CAH9019314.1 Cell division protein FtsQ [Candidatus Nitrosacidococcus sp. I8]
MLKNKKIRGASRPKPLLRPILLQVIGQGLFLLSLAGLIILGTKWFLDPKRLPLQEVNIEGEFKHLNKQDINDAIASDVAKGFFGIDLKSVQAATKKLPWIAQIKVRRVWPDQLKIQVKEQIPLARWGERSLVSIDGIRFSPPLESFPQNLPKIIGNTGSEQRVASQFKAIQQQLQGLGLRIVEFSIGDRQDCYIIFNNGIELVLGRAYNQQRLVKFYQIYLQLLQQHQEDIQKVDMRYANGFSVIWHNNEIPTWAREAVLDV